MNPETRLQNAIRTALGWDRDVVVWRQNTGAMRIEGQGRGRARFVRFGLSRGSSDLIGIVRTRIPRADGTTAVVGRFLALEVKVGTNKPTDEQGAFLETVQEFGGFACPVWSIDDALAAVARAKEGKNS